MASAVLLERLAVMLSGVAFLSFAYDWMRRDVQLARFWAALVLMCTAVSYSLVEDAAAVLSDVPAAAALMGGIVLLRRNRLPAGVAALALAAAIRPVNLVVFGAVLVWLAVSERKRLPVAARRRAI